MPELEPNFNRRKRFLVDPPADKIKLAKVWKLLESYSGIPPDEIEEHLRHVRAKAWAIFPYGCIGRWRFLDLYITALPQYPELLARTQQGQTLLDCACCFGQALRQLAFDGAPASSLVGLDLRREFIDLGYEMFRDKDTFGARFVTGSMLDPQDARLQVLDGTMDIIHAASFFHLFGWDDQVTIGERMVKFLKTDSGGATVLGRQIGSATEPLDPKEHEEKGLGRYHHNQRSMQGLWDVIGEKTGTRWKVEAELKTVLEELEDGQEEERTTIRFVVRQAD
ncbi:hypothetical protein B0H63DRAFT_449824 [Podospora didyma]|uniref:Methyltransferase domain-containing protein n=1 Tax=Podospora didyma TaxID=330526 RepID=A0AAE0TZZ8_9PEZI|nr:hypothetical protein B0H63DRAFT_449824 [Podospora didyma]